MQLTRKYHFYAAHRNQDLNDKCWSPHGHRYGIRVTFDLVKKTSITVLFADIDAKIKPILDEYDHSWLIDINDPLYTHIMKFPGSENFRLVKFNEPTSVENLAEKLFFSIKNKTDLNIMAIEVDETDSSTVRFSYDDVSSKS